MTSLTTTAQAWGRSTGTQAFKGLPILINMIEAVVNPDLDSRNWDAFATVLGVDSTWGEQEKRAARFVLGQVQSGVSVYKAGKTSKKPHKSGLRFSYKEQYGETELMAKLREYTDKGVDKSFRFNVDTFKSIFGIVSTKEDKTIEELL